MPDNPPGTPAPDAVEGDVVYNLDHHVMQYCNGTNWIAMGGGGGGLPTCADNEILQYNDPGDEWECVAVSAAETDPQVNTLTNNKWCTSNGTVVNCASDLPIGTLTNAKYCTTDGTTISCTSDGPAESDPQVGTLTNTKFCKANGTAIDCTYDEADPKIGTLTNTKWCTTNGTTISCTSDAPSGGGGAGGDIQTFNSSGTWTKPATGTIAMVECWGGGGSGGRQNGAGNPGGGGGGGYNMKWLPTSSLGATETVTVGAGGASQTVNNTPGNAGGTSSFGTHVYAYGGGGGGTGNGGGGGSPQGAGASNGTPGAPLLHAFFLDGDGNGSGTAIYVGQGATYIGAPGNLGAHGIVHGGGGGRNGVGYGSVYGGGGGGGSGFAGGASVFGGGAGGVGGGSPTAGTQPGGGGGMGESAASGAGGAGRCKVTVF